MDSSTSDRTEAGSSQTAPAQAWETSTSSTLQSRKLLQETLRYLRREDHSVPGIGAKVVEQFVDGHKIETLEGPEQDRFKLAQKVEAFLAKPDETTELLREIKGELKTAADFGEFNLELGDDAPYPETIAINIMKRVAAKHGVEL
jgi:hypothetical protein